MTTTIVSYGLAVSGLVLTAAALFLLHMRRLTIAAANRLLVTQLGDNQIERAKKICAAAPGSYFDAIRAAITALPQSKDRVDIDAAVHGAFEPIAKQLDRQWRARAHRGLLGALLVAAGLGLQLGDGAAHTLIWMAAGLGALGAIWLFALRGHMQQALASARGEVLPVLVEAATR